MERREKKKLQNKENKPRNHQATRPFGQRTTPQELEDVQRHRNPDHTKTDKRQLYERKVSPSEKRTKDAPEEADPDESASAEYV